jgi:hypothetical protein
MRLSRKLSLPLGTILLLGATLMRAGGPFTTIQNTGGGTIVFGPLSGQKTPVAALNETMKNVEAKCGDRPQLGQIVQNQTGTIWEAFFTVTNQNHGGAALTGMVIVYAPSTGTASAAVLIDTTDRFPQTVNSMFQRLMQAITGAAPSSQAGGPPTNSNSPQPEASNSPHAAPGPAQQLTPYIFPDGSGSMGLPPGWSAVRAQMGDIMATGPNGEKLRFGLTVPVIDPTNPQSRVLMGRGGPTGNFIAVPYNADAATLFAQASAQMAQKMRVQPPAVTVQNTQDLPLQGGKDFMIYGQVDAHDGRGAQAMVVQVVVTPPQVAGAYQMTIFEITAPFQTMVSEAATIAEIYPNYSRNSRFVNAAANAQIQQGLMQESQFLGTVRQDMDSSDRLTAGMSNVLRNQTVVLDTQTGGHATTSDGLASWLTQSNPNRFQVVPESDYISGIDY